MGFGEQHTQSKGERSRREGSCPLAALRGSGRGYTPRLSTGGPGQSPRHRRQIQMGKQVTERSPCAVRAESGPIRSRMPAEASWGPPHGRVFGARPTSRSRVCPHSRGLCAAPRRSASHTDTAPLSPGSLCESQTLVQRVGTKLAFVGRINECVHFSSFNVMTNHRAYGPQMRGQTHQGRGCLCGKSLVCRDLCGSGCTAGSELPGGHSGGLLGPAGWLPFAGAGRTAVSGRWFASRLRAVPHWVFWSHTFQFK